MKRISATFVALTVGFFILINSAYGQSSGFGAYTWNKDRRVLPTGVAVERVYNGTVNYLKTDGAWSKVNLTPRVSDDGLIVDQAPYSLQLPEFADGTFVFQNTTNFDVDQNRVVNQEAIGKSRVFAEAGHVPYEIQEDGSVLYKGAFPLIGADLRIIFQPSQVQYAIEWASAPLYACKGEYEFVEMVQQYSANASLKTGLSETDQAFSNFEVGGLGGRKIITPQPRIWDNSEESRQEEIIFIGRSGDSYLVLKKQIPCSFLRDEKTVYPVRTDDVDTIDNNLVDGYTRQDGSVWSTVRGAATATTTVDYTTGNTRVFSNFENPTYRIGRAFHTFDIGTIAGTITDVTFNGFINFVGNPEADAKSYITLFESQIASDTSISGSDYSQCETTKLTDDVALTTITASQYEAWTMNAAGESFVAAAQAGDEIVRLCAMEGHDIENVTPDVDNGDATGVNFSTVEAGNEAYLEITYTVGGGSSSSSVSFSGSTLSGALLPTIQANCVDYVEIMDGSGSVIGMTCSQYDYLLSGDFVDFVAGFMAYQLRQPIIALGVILLGFVILMAILKFVWRNLKPL
jgi:hypothetical protein